MRPAWLIFRKDLAVLRRSTVLVGVLVAYPILIAILIGALATYANAKPQVALVDRDSLPAKIVVGNQSFAVNNLIDEVAKNVKLIRLSPDEAKRRLDDGSVVGVITIPPGFLVTLQGLVRSPTLTFETGTGGLTTRVRQQMQALVFNLNLRLQRTFIEADLQYVRLLLHGGSGIVLGHTFHVLGLDGAGRVLSTLPHGPKLDAIRDFVGDARKALSLTGDAIKATAHPIQLSEPAPSGRSALLSSQAQSYGIALTVSFLALLLAAGALAGERDENVIGRLTRGLAGLGQLIGAKVALAATVAVGLGLTLAVGFGIAVEVANVAGGEPWQRLPLLVLGVALAGAALGALGAVVGGLAREARTASLVAMLLVLPIVFVGLVPREISPAAGWVSDAFPFVHAVRFFSSALYDVSPWATLGREAGWLIGLGAIFWVAARAAARRLAS